MVDGRTFFTKPNTNRAFARYLGLEISNRCPWDTNTLLETLLDLRNNAVTKAMQDICVASDDPMADPTADPIVSRPRHDLVDNLPKSMEISVPACDTAGSHTIWVLSAPQRNNKLSFEVTEENLSHLARMVPSFTSAPPSTQQSERMALGQPNVGFNKKAKHAVLHVPRRGRRPADQVDESTRLRER